MCCGTAEGPLGGDITGAAAANLGDLVSCPERWEVSGMEGTVELTETRVMNDPSQKQACTVQKYNDRCLVYGMPLHPTSCASSPRSSRNDFTNQHSKKM